MKDRSETRIALWTQNRDELFRAQDLDRDAERLEQQLWGVRQLAADCRKRAAEFQKAAEELGELDVAEAEQH